MREIDKILNANEKVLWEGSPKFWPYFFDGLFSLAFFMVMIWIGGVMSIILTSKNVDFSWGLILWMIFMALVGSWMMIGIPIYNLLAYRHVWYVITSKRVIIQRGLIGRDFEIMDFDQITNAEVAVSLWDRLVGKNSGSISITSAGSLTDSTRRRTIAKPNNIGNIESPYEVFKFFKQVSYDVKTDIEYPNQLRPKDNPGYQTDHKPDTNNLK